VGIGAALRVVAALAVAALLGACAVLDQSPLAAARIWDVHAGRFVDEATLVARIAPVRYRLLGEIHDDPLHHRLRAGLITAIAATGRRPAVVFEQFDLGHDAALASAEAAGADADAMADAGELAKRGWGWPLHRPLIVAALAAHLPIRAGNAPTSALRPVMAHGDTSSVDPAWRTRLAKGRWSPAQERALEDDIAAGHCHALPASLVPHCALAQRVRDAAMAEALVRDATADGAILIAGDGHVRRDLAVPVYLPEDEVVSVGFVEAAADDTGSPGLPARVAERWPGYDYIWFTPPRERPDPCATKRLPHAMPGG
jgi:uncharacterized iron-regulated protein